MKPTGYYLDEILIRLNCDRLRPVSQRNHLNPDIVLREVIKTDRHEDFNELMTILKEDGYIKRVNEGEHISDLDKNRDCLITMKGSFFIESGGYIQREKDKKRERRNLNLVNFCLAVGTSLAGLYALVELIKYIVSLFSPDNSMWTP